MSRVHSGVLSLVFLIYLDEDNPGDYVAHCLELDIVATGNTPAKAIELLKELIEDAILAAMKDDTLSDLCRPAPRKFWAKLAHATPFEPPKRTVKRRIKAEPIRRVDYALAEA